MSVQVPKGYKQTEVGVIPEEWSITSLGDSMSLVNGYAFKPSDWGKLGLPIIRIQNLNDYEAEFNYFSGTADPRNVIAEGDLLFAWSGTKGTSFGARVWGGPTGVLNQHIFKVIPKNNISDAYAYLVLRKAQEDIEKQAHGFKASFVHVKKSDLVAVQLAFPKSLAEQQAIAEALSDADALIESLEQLIAKKRQIKQGAMQELLTGQRRLPGFSGEWRKETIKNIVQTPVTDGPHMTPHFLNDGIPFLSVNNLVDGLIDFGDLRYISQADHEEFSRKCKPQKGDILLGKAASVGKVAIVETDAEFNIWSPIALIRLNNKNHGKYIYYQLQSDEVNKQISLLTNTSSQGNIGMGDIEKIVIPIPDKDEQIAIAEILTTLDAEIAELKIRVSKALKIKQAMMQELLTGRIRLI